MNRAHSEVQLIPYDDDWPRRFEKTKKGLELAFPNTRIEHIGSTSVPELSSKDTIDIAVGVPDVRGPLDARALVLLTALGFQFVPSSFADDDCHAFLHRIIGEHRTDPFT